MKLLDTLQTQIITAKFIKKNGEPRVMRCTLRKDLVPEVFGSSAVKNTDFITVWDLDKEGWRSLNKGCTYEITA